ncbi:SepM family pheromone-processing serine protease [Metabacillus iocasae]|uniref:endopeptidase La n=1 Tax=Priestia iocasae TaxID=2291674 RepID=A0ABS2QR06_9BACI|nr:SepM family pheromone-processing serine protease [Metabacillus iocasae]MBM7701753.1 PDZ domain-containing protein [Metabacillus iocasae]
MKSKSYILVFLCGVLLAGGVTFFPLPYYITKPGMAQELAPIVQVDGGYKEEGSFMLTTVRMGKATPLSYVLAQVQDFQHIYPEKEILQEGETDKEYTYRQLHMMETSKESAISVAYKKAGKKISFVNHGVYVMGVVKNMPAENKLEVGDRIVKVDDYEIKEDQDLISYVSKKKEGDSVTITFDREGKKQIETLGVEAFPGQEKRVGLGISLITDRELMVKPDIQMETDKIGGPSAGLMFSLEIYNQLVKQDMTGGYEIAGTGTLDDQGKVGRIGGIQQKVVAADQSGADIFFAPNEEGDENSNYNEAVKAGKEIKTKMKIVPVDTFDDAVSYLETLTKK